MACNQGIESLHVANDSPYLVPLMFGWKREVVLRSNTSSSRADVYYIPPKGKKCRSLNDVERAIQGTQLTIEGFTFAEKLLGVNDPNKEVVRSASNAAVFKKTSLNESIDPSSPPNKKARISPENSKVKQELQVEEDKPDVTDKSSLDESSKLKNYETGVEEVSDSSNVLKSQNLRRSTCPPEGPSSSEPTSTNQVSSSTTNVTGNISSEEEHDPLDIAIPMGSNSQVAIPSCVVSAVRERFPEQNGSYSELISLPINASYTPLDGIAALVDERNDIVEVMTEDMTMAERMMRIFS
ncbi:hypothetical protein GE061_009116 [Apolygus lucorum]|uniref:MBD domain-containing protein n=1 Tax=Apolygus lucorum TaxID=248454 RepID=A0A8S9Y207_APOLU|nr:hypothetical protein GE061_009116 [Apolygus lucorum]